MVTDHWICAVVCTRNFFDNFHAPHMEKEIPCADHWISLRKFFTVIRRYSVAPGGYGRDVSSVTKSVPWRRPLYFSEKPSCLQVSSTARTIATIPHIPPPLSDWPLTSPWPIMSSQNLRPFEWPEYPPRLTNVLWKVSKMAHLRNPND